MRWITNQIEAAIVPAMIRRSSAAKKRSVKALRRVACAAARASVRGWRGSADCWRSRCPKVAEDRHDAEEGVECDVQHHPGEHHGRGAELPGDGESVQRGEPSRHVAEAGDEADERVESHPEAEGEPDGVVEEPGEAAECRGARIAGLGVGEGDHGRS